MVKHARKKQRLTKAAAPDVQPLGSTLADDAGKDDEERRLESLLFGTAHEPSDETERELVVLDGEPEELAVGGEKELQNLLDTDLFFVDDGAGQSTSADAGTLDAAQAQSTGEDSAEESEEDQSHDYDGTAEQRRSQSDEDIESEPVLPPGPLTRKQTQSKAPAWTDPDDTTLEVSLGSDSRLRKLRDALSEDTVGGREYERRLRRQFEKINPTPAWAAAARKKPRPAAAKRRRASSASGSDSEADGDGFPNLLSSTNGIVAPPPKVKLQVLSQGTLAIERLRDANLSAKSEGQVKAVQFHPSPRVPVLLTAGADRRLRLFNVDGHTNPHLQTVHVPSLPVSTALFHPGGASVLLTGPRPFYYVYDLQSGTALRSPRGLWGTFGAHEGAEAHSMEVCAFDPTGALLAVAGRRGHVHLADWRAGQGQVVASVKMNTGARAVWWAGGRLMSLGEDAEVYVWDVGERRCVRRWKDDGGFGSRVMGGDGAGKYLAIGSKTGLVNVYGSDGLASSGSDRPKPLKTIGNLTTSITSLRFNNDSQLLAIASNQKKDQMRMIHLPSLTAFANWPTSSTPLGHVTNIDFSSGSEYVAIGNNRGRVLLYHLGDFASQ